jgi:predicted deacetylase
MTQYILRLDDASPYRNLENWNRLEDLLKRYDITPIVGIIPNNKDVKFSKYSYDSAFWSRVRKWQEIGWCIALHGYDHVYCSESGGINPVNQQSEFAGLPLQVQEEKIEKGIAIMREQGIMPRVFFAPSHTFDENTLLALKNKSDIRIISDTVANDVYYKNEFFFIPQQAGSVRKVPLRTVTFCYHPDGMSEIGFSKLEHFIIEHQSQFISLAGLKMTKRRKTPYDYLLSIVYLKLRFLLR